MSEAMTQASSVGMSSRGLKKCFRGVMLTWYLKPRVDYLNLLGSGLFLRCLVMMKGGLHKLLQS